MKKLCIFGCALLVAGVLILAVIMSINNWDFSALNTAKTERKTYTVTEPFRNISIDVQTDDVCFEFSEDEECVVECYERVKQPHTVDVKEGTLQIKVNLLENWYDHIGIGIENTKITVRLPQSTYENLVIDGITGDVTVPEGFSFENVNVAIKTGDVTCCADVIDTLKLKTTTGDIRAEGTVGNDADLNATTGSVNARSFECGGSLSLSCSTGDTVLRDTTCHSLTSTGSTGDAVFENVIAEKSISVDRSTGDVTINGCDADEITVTTTTGDVTGRFLSDKVFITDTKTGSVDTPKTVKGGKCEIKTTTGDIRIG